MNKKKYDPSDAEGIVSNYFLDHNRPYSANDIAQNLHKELGKSGIQKVLDKLTQDGFIMEKAYGKQKIYFLDQNSLPDATPDEIKALDIQIEEEERVIKECDRMLKEVLAESKKVADSLTTDEIRATVEHLRSEVGQMEVKLKALTETTVVVDKVERDRSRRHLKRCVKEWKIRKNYCMNTLGSILESNPSGPKDLFEEIGLVTDEEAGVKMPSS